jgi:hypothetical protein
MTAKVDDKAVANVIEVGMVRLHFGCVSNHVRIADAFRVIYYGANTDV